MNQTPTTTPFAFRFEFPPDIAAEREPVLAAIRRQMAEGTRASVARAAAQADWLGRFPDDYGMWDIGEARWMLADALEATAPEARRTRGKENVMAHTGSEAGSRWQLEFPPEIQAQREPVLTALDRAMGEATVEAVREAQALASARPGRHPEDFAILDAGEPTAVLADALAWMEAKQDREDMEEWKRRKAETKAAAQASGQAAGAR